MEWYITNLMVRYADTDQMGVMYYSNYLIWFEVARTEFFREKGISYDKIEKERKLYLPVAEAYCRYKAPLKYDDIVSVKTRIKDIGKTRLVFEYEIEKEGKTATEGFTSHAFVDASGRPVAVPDDIRGILS